MDELRVRSLPDHEAAVWPEALQESATFTALDSWSRLVSDAYGYKIFRYEVRQKGEITGILVLTHVRHPLFGTYLTTSPFGSYGGFAYHTDAARDALLGRASQLAENLAVQYTLVRFLDDGSHPPSPWRQNPIYATYLIDLPGHAGELWESFSSQYRNHIRKSLKKGFRIRFGHLDVFDEVYEGLACSMHELGSPYHSRSYLRHMAELLGPALEFAVVRGPQGELAGAGVFILSGKVVTNLHANILRRFRPDYAGDFLYWSVMTRYGESGFSTLDLGRSLIGSGNETFKLKGKPRKKPLAYWYALRGRAAMPDLNQRNPRFQLAINAWKRLPDFIVRPLGPLLIRGLA